MRQILIGTLILLSVYSCRQVDSKAVYLDVFPLVEQQLQGMSETIGNTPFNPRCTNEDGSLRLVKSKDWTSGFYPGILWMQYEYSRDEKWRRLAEKYTANVMDQQYNAGTHDMGFKMYCSYGNGFRMTNNSEYKSVLLQSANTLMTRYNSKVGCIRSWDFNKKVWDFPVIIDNMMNLELLFWASQVTRDSSYYKAAYSHALTTMENHFRADNSCYHVVDYNPLTGKVQKYQTHQGINDESAWARGQSWALYGFTMAYRETGDKRFLTQAEKVVRYIMTHPRLPKDGVPYWDFDDPSIPDAPRDASAAAVIASACYELSLYSDFNVELEAFADQLISSLSSEKYLAKAGTNNHFILKHSTGNMPKNDEVDQPIVYADYYYVEALLRRMKLDGGINDVKPKVFLKLDDIRLDTNKELNERWLRVMDYAIAHELKINPGIIGNCLHLGDEAFVEQLKSYQDSEFIEYWNHGYDHKKRDIGNGYVAEFKQDYNYQLAQFKKSQDLSVEKLGKAFNCFGAPYNHNNDTTAFVVKQFPEIKAWLYPPNNAKELEGVRFLHRIPALNLEYPVHQPVLYYLWNNLYFHENEAVIVLQGHPYSWDDKRFAEFEKMIAYLKESGYTFVNCSDL